MPVQVESQERRSRSSAVVGFEKCEAEAAANRSARRWAETTTVFCHRHVGFTAPYPRTDPSWLDSRAAPHPVLIYLAGPIVMSIEARSPLFAVATANGGKMT
jgi:hypothetical protein